MHEIECNYTKMMINDLSSSPGTARTYWGHLKRLFDEHKATAHSMAEISEDDV